MESPKKVIIAAGGTGGHVFPGIVIAQAFKDLNVEVLWIGTKHGVEAKVVPKYSFPFETLRIKGIRNNFFSKLLLPGRLFVSIFKSIQIIRRYRPCGVLGMGGYPSFPVGIAAWLTCTPLIIHEQNTFPGLANKVLFYFARLSLTSYPDVFVARNFKTKSNIQLVGNPVRAVIYNIPVKSNIDSENIKILILGGSQGARFLNTKLPYVFANLPNKGELNIYHQTGENDLELAKLNYQDKNIKVKCISFIDNIEKAYNWADLVIARAGALTLAELMAAGRGSILIPYPYAADDHQTKNATFLSVRGAALLWKQIDFCIEDWTKILHDLITDKKKVLEMGAEAKKLGRIDATQLIIKNCMENYVD